MNPQEFFNAKVEHYFGSGHDYGEWTRSYWELEFVSATINGAYYSDWFDEKTEALSRTCELCGRANHTDEFGRIIFCSDELCKQARIYWGLTTGQRPFLANGKNGSQRMQRATWLRAQLREHYGDRQCNSIYGLPIDCRLSVLLSMQIVREQIEYGRIERDAKAAASSHAAEPVKGKQRQGEVADGNGCSVY